MRHIADKVGAIFLLSVLGFLFPFAWPRHRVNLFNLFAFLGGFWMVAAVAIWVYTSYGLRACVAVFVLVNWLLVLVWFLVCIAATIWLGSSKPQDPPA